MLGIESGTAEEFYSRCLANAQTLEGVARQRAADLDVVGALADAWGADLNMLQAVMWERILVASRTPQRQFFQVAEAVVAGLGARPAEPPTTLARMITGARERMAHAFDEALTVEMAGRWPDIGYLELLPAPTAEDFEHATSTRLAGLSPDAFIERRRSEARSSMLEAQTHRVRGETGDGIRLAYQADFQGLEAYLVESARAVGDVALLTVAARWDLVVHAMAEVPGLPDDFAAAVRVVRSAMAAALGQADGSRLLASLPTV